MVTGPGFSSPNQPDQERTTAYRDSSGPDSRSDAHCAIIIGNWEELSREYRLDSDVMMLLSCRVNGGVKTEIQGFAILALAGIFLCSVDSMALTINVNIIFLLKWAK